MLNKFPLLLAISIFIASSSTSYAQNLIGNVFTQSNDNRSVVVVEKSTHKLYLLGLNKNEQSIEKEIVVLTGEVDGNKQKRGDKKTPEGVYYVVDHMSASTMLKKWGSYAEIYGTGAFPLSYPNVIDSIRKKTGNGIWIHGLDPLRHKPFTEGCVGLQNTDLDGIMANLKLGTAVVVVDNITFMTAEEYNVAKAESVKRLDDFISHWSNGPFDQFKTFVHPDYRSYAANNAKTYLQNKKAVIELYPDKYINVSNLTILDQKGDQLVYEFDQFYCANNLTSYGTKRLYFAPDEQDNGTLKLISEEMDHKQVSRYITPTVNTFLDGWKTAWESKDIDSYMGYYDPSFKDIEQWKSNKERIFSSINNISVGIDGVKWELIKGNDIKVTFKQSYMGDNLSDVGVKTIVLKGCSSNYRIISEDWRAIK